MAWQSLPFRYCFSRLLDMHYAMPLRISRLSGRLIRSKPLKGDSMLIKKIPNNNRSLTSQSFANNIDKGMSKSANKLKVSSSAIGNCLTIGGVLAGVAFCFSKQKGNKYIKK